MSRGNQFDISHADHLSQVRRAARTIFLPFVLILSACGDPIEGDVPCDAPDIDETPGSGIERLGAVTVCFATDSGDDGTPDVQEFVGLTPVAEDALTEPPELFRECALGVAETGEFLDADGTRVWLGIAAHYGARQLVPRGLLRLIDDAELRLHRVTGFVPTTSLSIVNGAQLLVALEVSGRGTGPFGTLLVESAGSSGPAVVGPCGDETPLALRFRDDTNDRSVANGEDAELLVGNREFVATNIHSVDHGETDCTDSPSGVDATWIAVDHSL